ncbi:MAG: hypothetical protein U0836_03135 [Pirellulales bacterium]
MSLPRRLRSFSLRTLMVLVGVACFVAAWPAREWSMVLERHAFLDRLYSAGGDTERASQFVFPPPDDECATIPWMRRLLGGRPVDNIIFNRRFTDDDLAVTARLFPEASITDHGKGAFLMLVPPTWTDARLDRFRKWFPESKIIRRDEESHRDF